MQNHPLQFISSVFSFKQNTDYLLYCLDTLMKCSACLYSDTKVLDSRISSDGYAIRRRRECLKCSFRFSTYEEVEILDLTVIKRDGKRETYSRDKLINGLKRSLEKRPVEEKEFKKLLHRIEHDIQMKNKNEMKTSQIGEIIMKNLKRVDQVAYIRFASVYRSFEDAATFRRELNKLIKNKKKTGKKSLSKKR